MATAAVIGLSAGKRLLSSSFYYSDISEKLAYTTADHPNASAKSLITAKKSSNFSASFLSNRQNHSLINALKEHVDNASTVRPLLPSPNHTDEVDDLHPDYSVEVLLLLQKSMLEKQWNLSAENRTKTCVTSRGENSKKLQVACSGTSARRRRIESRRLLLSKKCCVRQQLNVSRKLRSIVSPDLLQNRFKGYVKGVISEDLLSHAEVVQLSNIIKEGLCLEEQKERYCVIFLSLFIVTSTLVSFPFFFIALHMSSDYAGLSCLIKY